MFSKKEELLTDLLCVARRLEVVSDLVHYNSTMLMGEKYQEWIDKHKQLMQDLYGLISGDIKALTSEDA